MERLSGGERGSFYRPKGHPTLLLAETLKLKHNLIVLVHGGFRDFKRSGEWRRVLFRLDRKHLLNAHAATGQSQSREVTSVEAWLSFGETKAQLELPGVTRARTQQFLRRIPASRP